MALSAPERPSKWVSKKEAFRIPLIGWNMYLNQYMSTWIAAMSQRARDDGERVGRGWSTACLMMFPGGIARRMARFTEFHSGAFKLAIDTGAAVVPIVVDGTWPIYRGFKVAAFPGTVTIRVLDPISATGNANQLCEETFARMQRELAAIRGRPVPEKREVG